MTFLDTVLSIVPSVPFLPPAAPAKDVKGVEQQKQTGAFNRFLGTDKPSDKIKPAVQNEGEN